MFGAEIVKKIKTRLHYYFYEENWNVGFVQAPFDELLKRRYLENIKWLKRKEDTYFLADPFWIHDLGSNQLLCEYYSFKQRVGKISLVQFNDDLKVTSIEHKLNDINHYSFPFLIKIDNQVVCIPECSQSNSLRSFNLTTTKGYLTVSSVNALMNERMIVDPIILKRDSLFWLFCTIKGKNENSDLHIFYSKELNSNWKAHKKNPVVQNLKGGRNAGSIYESKGKYYRPGQDCSEQYGGGLVINQILKLNTEEYEEVFVNRIGPNPASRYNQGIHTLNEYQNGFLVDGKQFVFSPFKLLTLINKRLANK